jgi:NADH-quinone oxidoreductase subunit M
LFFFWSLSSLPVFFLVGIWGGTKKEQAAFRVLVTNTLGNTLLFAAFVLIYYAKDPHTFLIRELITSGGIPQKLISVAGVDVGISEVAFLFVCLGLALRAPVWPLHGWFSQLAHEAPPSVFVAVSAVSVPVAVMIFARLSNLLFPQIMSAGAAWVLGAGVLNLLVGSVAILSQRRLSALVAHLSLAHLGLALVGLGSQNASAMVGVIYHQLGFGLALAAFGLLLGGLSLRAGILDLSGSSEGLAERAPTAAAITGLAMGCFIGVPGLSGFVGQSLIVMGGYASHPAVLFIVGCTTLLIAYSLFGMFRQLFLGGADRSEGSDTRGGELPPRERLFLIPLVALIVLLGFYPKPFIDWVRPTAFALVSGQGVQQGSEENLTPSQAEPADSGLATPPTTKPSPSPLAPAPAEKKGT